jgi:hypothetical protein
MTDMTPLSRQIISVIQSTGVTPHRLAVLVGTCPANMYGFIEGRRPITLATLDKVGLALGLTIQADPAKVAILAQPAPRGAKPGQAPSLLARQRAGRPTGAKDKNPRVRQSRKSPAPAQEGTGENAANMATLRDAQAAMLARRTQAGQNPTDNATAAPNGPQRAKDEANGQPD